MTFSFDKYFAIKYGVEESIMINNFIFWISKNKSEGRNNFDGKTWTYNSVETYAELFPFWSVNQVRRILDSLKDKGVLVTGNYNKVSYDRTLWYAFADESILPNRQIDSLESTNGNVKSNEPIPDIIPNIKPDIKPDVVVVKKPQLQQQFVTLTKIYQERWGLFPPFKFHESATAILKRVNPTDRDLREIVNKTNRFDWILDKINALEKTREPAKKSARADEIRQEIARLQEVRLACVKDDTTPPLPKDEYDKNMQQELKLKKELKECEKK